jgi:hypothetical protein
VRSRFARGQHRLKTPARIEQIHGYLARGATVSVVIAVDFGDRRDSVFDIAKNQKSGAGR